MATHLFSHEDDYCTVLVWHNPRFNYKELSKVSYLVLIDLTATIESGLNTGIQRVSKELARNLAEISDEQNVKKFLPVFFRITIFGRCLIYPVLSIPSNNQSHTFESVPILIKIRTWLRKNTLLRMIIFSVVLRRVTSRVYSGIAVRKFQRQGIIDVTPLLLEENHRLLLLDQFWNSTASLRVLAKFKRQKKPYSVFVHDLLPLTHSSYFERNTSSHFRNIVPNILRSARQIFVASDFVKSEIHHLLPDHQFVQKIFLGSDIPNRAKDLPKQNSEIPAKFLLQVGTLEPRKNHEQILRWYLRSKHDEALIIVGNPGWRTRKLQKFLLKCIKTSQGKILWMRNIDDDKLQTLIEKSSVGICASSVEGYDLPMREFLYNSKPVVASDIPAHRDESLKPFLKLIHYFRIDDDEDLDMAIMGAKTSLNRVQPELSLLTWREAAAKLADSFGI